jgi:hypothetical protein
VCACVQCVCVFGEEECLNYLYISLFFSFVSMDLMGEDRCG